MGAQQACKHGVPFFVPPGEPQPQCPECDLIWHEGCLEWAKASVALHKRKCDEAIAAISRQCGDA